MQSNKCAANKCAANKCVATEMFGEVNVLICVLEKRKHVLFLNRDFFSNRNIRAVSMALIFYIGV